MSRTETLTQVAAELRGRTSFFLCTHRHPDGDGLGSTLALFWVLREMGKRVSVYAQDDIPRVYRFLPGWEEFDSEARPEGSQVAVVLDCGRLERAGDVADSLANHPLLINIDHHWTNAGFGALSLMDPESCATGELVYRLIKEIPWRMSPPVALNLYAAIASDTANFQNANTTREAFEVAAELTGLGVKPAEVARQLFDRYSAARMRLLGLALSALEIQHGGRLAAVFVTREMLERAGATYEDVAGLVTHVASVAGVEAAVLVSQVGEERFEVSLRGRNGANVAQVAEGFGGGGHPNAAGFSIRGPLAQVRSQVLQATAQALEAKRQA